MEACSSSITRPAAGLIRTQRPEMCDSAVKDQWDVAELIVRNSESPGLGTSTSY
jgi:hypothetical protein